MSKFWFKPKRFWHWFAFYYPTSWQGWLITLVLGATLVKIFLLIDATAHSNSDTLIRFTPWAVSLGLIFDLLCLRTGLYPSWWRSRHS